MNEFGDHGPTRDPALGDAARDAERTGSQNEANAEERHAPEEAGSGPRKRDTGEPDASTPPAGREHEQAGTGAARGALSEHE